MMVGFVEEVLNSFHIIKSKYILLLDKITLPKEDNNKSFEKMKTNLLCYPFILFAA